MKGLSILILVALSSHFALCKKTLNAKSPVHTRMTEQNADLAPKERRLNFDNELQTGSLYVQQLENTNANLNEMTGHSRLQTSMKKIGQWFGDVEERLDDFRDSVARKLNELHMSLQRPKVPIMGPAAMMLHPSMNPALPSTFNNGSFGSGAGSMLGPQPSSMYSSPLFKNSQVSNASLGSAPSAIPSQLYGNSSNNGSERRLLQMMKKNNKRQKIV